MDGEPGVHHGIAGIVARARHIRKRRERMIFWTKSLVVEGECLSASVLKQIQSQTALICSLPEGGPVITTGSDRSDQRLKPAYAPG